MRKFMVLCSALFCLSLTASAQDSTAALEAGTSEAVPAAPAPFIPADREPWQINAGFMYQHYSVLGQNFHNLAYQAGLTRFFNNYFGVEGAVLTGFGHAGSNPSITAKSLFLGGGAHISVRNTEHLEPWVHVLARWERFRFTESNVLGDNSHAAFLAGGGLDYKINGGRLYWRVQGDFMGTNVGGSGFSKNYMVGTGLVLNF
jgi:hypothetical protein